MNLPEYTPKKWDELYDLTKEPTQRLMNWRDKCYACGGQYDPVYGGTGPSIPLQAILNELDKREHVPNKQEAKAIRQEKAQAGKRKKTAKYGKNPIGDDANNS